MGGAAFTPAAHTAAPQVVNADGGSVLAKPKVMTITYAGDPQAIAVDKLVAALGASSYWSATTSEYGVGVLTALSPVHLPEVAPASIDDSTIVASLKANTTGASPAWGPADPSTIYLFVFPEGTIVQAGGACCDTYDGYHGDATIGVKEIPYAVVCECAGFDGPGIPVVESTTVAVSHELIEAATDPFVQSTPAFSQTDDPDAIWTLVTGGEVADMCTYNTNTYVKPADVGFVVQRSWSNAAAKAGHNPCVPADPVPYFNAVPVLPDNVTLQYFGAWHTKGIKIPLGQSADVEIDLFSDAPTAVPWTLQAWDASEFNGGPKLLSFTWDATSGQNGDKRKLTIKVLAIDPQVKGEGFILEARHGTQDNLWMGVVGN